MASQALFQKELCLQMYIISSYLNWKKACYKCQEWNKETVWYGAHNYYAKLQSKLEWRWLTDGRTCLLQGLETSLSLLGETPRHKQPSCLNLVWQGPPFFAHWVLRRDTACKFKEGRTNRTQLLRERRAMGWLVLWKSFRSLSRKDSIQTRVLVPGRLRKVGVYVADE